MNLPRINVEYIDPYEGVEFETDKFLLNLYDILSPYTGEPINKRFMVQVYEEYKDLVREYEFRDIPIQDVTCLLDDSGNVVIGFTEEFINLKDDSREVLF